jgi:uncharacterized membrane protein
MNYYLLYKWLHILSSVVLVGVGFGSAFYMWCTLRSRNLSAIVTVSRIVVLADWIFTTPAVLIQPLTGYLMMRTAGFGFDLWWLQLTLMLYAISGLCWLPVVWLQIQLRQMAVTAHTNQSELPTKFWRYARWWELLGYPAFAAMLVIYWLMVFKPV